MKHRPQIYMYLKALCFVALLGTLVLLNGCATNDRTYGATITCAPHANVCMVSRPDFDDQVIWLRRTP